MNKSNDLDVPRVIDRFGGRTQLHSRLVREGHDVSIKMLEKWRERGRIPANWIVELIRLARAEGKPLDLNDYLVRENGAEDVLA